MKSDNHIEYSVIVPVKDEADNVSTLISEIYQAMTSLDIGYEIIFIDDASQDQTLSIMQEMMHDILSLRVLSHEKNCGQSASIYSGVKTSVGKYIIVLDGDGQNNPIDIPNLIQAIRSTEDIGMVIGHRVNRKDDGQRKLSSLIANKIRSNLLKDNAPDSGCGLKIIRRDIFLSLPFFNHMHRFMVALVQRAGYRVLSIPVDHRPRIHGVSKYDLFGRLGAGIIDLFGVWWLIYRMKNPIVHEVTRIC